MFVDNFGKCGPIFNILRLVDLQENSLCIHHKDFHLTGNMLHLPKLSKVKWHTFLRYSVHSIVSYHKSHILVVFNY